MITFLPYDDFQETARCLDMRRLGKQRLEAWQIYQIITNEKLYDTYKGMPIIKMWKNWDHALLLYGNEICKEWIRRGYKSTIHRKFEIALSNKNDMIVFFPVWLNDPRLINSHRSNLLRKKEAFYIRYRWNVPNDIPYFWPR